MRGTQTGGLASDRGSFASRRRDDPDRLLVTLIIRANSRREKLPVLYDLRERLEELHVLLRIGNEVQAFQKFTAYGHADNSR